MDIARTDIKRQKKRKQILVVAISIVLLGVVSFGVSRLKPAAPEVERGTVWTDTVKRGPMLRQVRGLGSLIPSQEFTRQIPAETEATVVRIHMLPGSQVKADSVLLEMSNPQAEQTALDASLQLKAAEAEYQSLRVKLQSDLMNQKAGAATVTADYSQAKLQSETDKALYDLGVISGLTYKASKGKSDELTTRKRFVMKCYWIRSTICAMPISRRSFLACRQCFRGHSQLAPLNQFQLAFSCTPFAKRSSKILRVPCVPSLKWDTSASSSMLLNVDWSESQTKQMRKLLDDLGIRCSSTHNNEEYFNSDNIHRTRDMNLILGSKYVVMANSHPKPGADGWKLIADELNSAAEQLEPSGLKPGYHNHQPEFTPVDGVRPIEILARNT